MESHQVVIVGAGPAGSSCAKALKEEGIDVLIIEKEILPRYKTCSGVLFGQTQVLLNNYFGGLPPKSVYCRPEIINNSNIMEWNREKGFFEFVWELPKDGIQFPTVYYNIWRNLFDLWLLEESGAEYRQGWSLKGFSLKDDNVAVEVTSKDDKTTRLSCSYLIGADGGNSKLRRLLDPAWIKESLVSSVYQTYNRFSDSGDLEEGKWAVFFEPDISETLCCVHHKDDFLTLCVGGFSGRDLKAVNEMFKKFLEDEFSVVFEQQERVEGCVMRMGPPNLGRGRIILTGEAAGFMYLNGEGISVAIDSGYRAGKAVAKAIREGFDAIDIYGSQSIDLLRHVSLCTENAHFFSVQP
jgi:flavin-dependent dehydrogenase